MLDNFPTRTKFFFFFQDFSSILCFHCHHSPVAVLVSPEFAYPKIIYSITVSLKISTAKKKWFVPNLFCVLY